MIDRETQRLASIFDAMEASVYIISDDYAVEFMNKTAIAAFGDGLGRKCYEVIAGAEHVCPWCRARQVFEGETQSWEHAFSHLDKTFEVFELPLEKPDGTLSHMCIYRDITRRKAREKRLTASIEDYRSLFERIGCGVYIITREGRFVDANAALLDMLYYNNRDQLIAAGMASDIFLSSSDWRTFQEIIERSGHVNAYEAELRRRDGSIISALINSRVRFDEKDDVIGYEGIIVDLSQRKEMERNLQKAHDFLNNLIQSSIDAIVAVDRRGYIILFNESAETIYGYTRTEALAGMHVTRLYSENDARQIKKLIYAEDQGGPGRLVNYELEVLNKEGFTVPITLSAALLSENGVEIGSVGFFKDMRKVKQLEDALTKRFAFEHNLIHSSIDAIAASDHEGHIIVFNRSAEKLLGFCADEVIGKLGFRDFLPEEAMADELREALQSNRHSGQNRLLLYETTLINKIREKIPVQLSATTMFEGGQPIGIVAFFRDLREIRRLEQQFADQARLLHEHKMISLGRLSASVVHELNNPLAGILNYLRLMLKILQRGVPTGEALEKFQRYLTLSESETGRCSKIVSNLLAFSRKSDLEISAVNVIELLERCVLLSQHKLMLSNITIHTDFSPNTPNVLGDFSQIHQAVINLIFNAVDAMPEGGSITIACGLDPQNKSVFITVADTGQGIAQEDIQKIFDPFFSTKIEGKGLGLGLSVVYGIIDRHKGKIHVDSKPGQGTMFTISLPAAKSMDNPKNSGT
jgi:PAS domain S-box-containing protein